MGVQGIHKFSFERAVCAHVDRDIQPVHKFQNLQDVLTAHFNRRIAGDDSYAGHLQLILHRERQHDGKAVIDSRITVYDHSFSHEKNSSKIFGKNLLSV